MSEEFTEFEIDDAVESPKRKRVIKVRPNDFKDIPNDRLTANISVTYESTGEQPQQMSCVFSELLQTESGEAYLRRVILNKKWTPLDCGFVENPGTLVIDNRAGKFLKKMPSEGERKASAECVIEISYSGDGQVDALISPGRFAILEPADFPSVQFRSRSDETKIFVAVIPK
jgi:hypothetical protein